MVPFFVQIKCELGKSYDVATAIADAEIEELWRAIPDGTPIEIRP